jgi:hypothetical protein
MLRQEDGALFGLELGEARVAGGTESPGCRLDAGVARRL